MTGRRASAPASRHDVAIVGAGAVGLLLACLLAQRQLDVVVLERRTEPASVSRAFGIHPPGMLALDAAGVGDAVRAEALVIRSGAALSGGRRLGRLDFGDRAIHALPQERTEALLRERLAALAPAALRAGAEVTALQQHPRGVELALASGGRVDARWAVGADGVHSRVRDLLHIERTERRGGAGYAMADVDAPEAAGDADPTGASALLHLEPGGVIESLPLPGGRRRWVARLASPEEEVSAGRLEQILGERLSMPGGGRAVERLPEGTVPSAFRARQRMAKRFESGRVALAGDAAHEVSPIGGQGMSLGWLDALALDRAIADAWVDDVPAPFGRYARERRRAAALAMRRAAWNMAMGAPAGPVLHAARLTLARTLVLPPSRAALVAAFTMRGL
ncbi:FAD-dependent oxidoreductase [Agrococcus sp. Marseille-P2731]|uniref:FAD-dependent oxidoreductase n=1 Tax=Agrococcus sp. Marseille-P2731 TaxID=1841862 RepID=UPI000930FFD8|nr:NAD(P)/FAD-dependent oxidoreductase [Agrococcus sp. Marseille-P2731]